jgi:hypothetical protein
VAERSCQVGRLSLRARGGGRRNTEIFRWESLALPGTPLPLDDGGGWAGSVGPHGRGRPRHIWSRLLGWADEDFAYEGLRGLGYQHRHGVGYVLRLQHLAFVFAGVGA